MKIFRSSKKRVPEELPDLTIDNSKISIETVRDFQKENSPKLLFDESKSEVLMDEEKDESGFFKEMMDTLVKEDKNLDKIESFYNNRFMTEDIVDQMRSYWENKKPELLLKSVGKDLKEKIVKQSGVMHKLEHEWQDIYFALLNKEEQIRAEEKELKETISEFMTVCKKASKRKRN